MCFRFNCDVFERKGGLGRLYIMLDKRKGGRGGWGGNDSCTGVCYEYHVHSAGGGGRRYSALIAVDSCEMRHNLLDSILLMLL